MIRRAMEVFLAIELSLALAHEFPLAPTGKFISISRSPSTSTSPSPLELALEFAIALDLEYRPLPHSNHRR